MAETAAEKSYRSPLGVTAEDGKNNTVHVCIILPGLEKKLLKSEAKNGTVEVDFSDRSLNVRVELNTKQSGTKKTEYYRYVVKRLPDDILPEKCRFMVEKDKVVLSLAKAKQRSWAAELDQSGLETFRPAEAGDD